MGRVRPAVGTGVGLGAALAALVLAGCSTVVMPKNAAATVSPTISASPSPSSSSATPTPSASTTVAGKDVDHTVCGTVRTEIATALQKAETDKNSDKKSGADLHALGTELKTQAAKTKVSLLKSVLTTLGGQYQTLGTDTEAGRSTAATADQAKVDASGTKLDEQCAEKPTASPSASATVSSTGSPTA